MLLAWDGFEMALGWLWNILWWSEWGVFWLKLLQAIFYLVPSTSHTNVIITTVPQKSIVIFHENWTKFIPSVLKYEHSYICQIIVTKSPLDICKDQPDWMPDNPGGALCGKTGWNTGTENQLMPRRSSLLETYLLVGRRSDRNC